MENILCTLSALQLDALGGHGSRGYGKVSFRIAELERLEPSGKAKKDFDELKSLVYNEDSIKLVPEAERERFEVCCMTLENAQDKINKIKNFSTQDQPEKDSKDG